MAILGCIFRVNKHLIGIATQLKLPHPLCYNMPTTHAVINMPKCSPWVLMFRWKKLVFEMCLVISFLREFRHKGANCPPVHAQSHLLALKEISIFWFNILLKSCPPTFALCFVGVLQPLFVAEHPWKQGRVKHTASHWETECFWLTLSGESMTKEVFKLITWWSLHAAWKYSQDYTTWTMFIMVD